MINPKNCQHLLFATLEYTGACGCGVCWVVICVATRGGCWDGRLEASGGATPANCSVVEAKLESEEFNWLLPDDLELSDSELLLLLLLCSPPSGEEGRNVRLTSCESSSLKGGIGEMSTLKP